ncbi:hypothetical protein J2X86_002456 [Acinetobacter lwoffii]|jgi:hypothetical protein|uniref:Uncharacterized protein n=1 Tax=Acinetobacter lwoffii TaxID=28090 RepID=A0AAW8LKY4_ACILW|nr:hypothetical protein [Acinetobacter lwoffii]MDR6630401.1 hypothetical protein [Acinetobacter lwoffii]
MKQKMYIDCRVGAFGEDPLRMIATFDTQNDQVTISKSLPYFPSKDPYKGKTAQQIKIMKEIERNTVIVVDNALVFPKWDLSFSETEHLADAVKAYALLDTTHCLILSDEVKQRYDPKAILQVRKMDVKGKDYELNSEDLTNGNIAVLLVCWAVIRMRNSAVLHEEGLEPTQQDIDSFDVPFTV